MNELELLRQFISDAGAFRTGAVDVDAIPFEPEFRKLCESNACGMYGANWMCPPALGEVDDLIRDLKRWRWAVVYQTVDTLEDSYDFEGMMAAKDRMSRLTALLRRELAERHVSPALFLGAGGCRLCPRCGKLDNQPCRFPDQAIPSMEAYGINVSALAPMVGMKYINGPDTVTFFGAVLLGEA